MIYKGELYFDMGKNNKTLSLRKLTIVASLLTITYIFLFFYLRRTGELVGSSTPFYMIYVGGIVLLLWVGTIIELTHRRKVKRKQDEDNIMGHE